MSCFTKNWLLQEYTTLYIENTGVDALEEDEKEFLKSFFDAYSNSKGKEIYYKTVYKFKKNYPKFLIFFFLKKELKKAFTTKKAPDSFIKLSDEFAQKMLFNAMKAYCKISD